MRRAHRTARPLGGAGVPPAPGRRPGEQRQQRHAGATNPPAQDVAQSRLPPLTTSGGIQMGMTPPHPGAFIRIEAIEVLGSSVSAAVTQVGMTRGTLRGKRRAHSSEIHSGIRTPVMINNVQPADFGGLVA